jgi:hypothetical protein
LRVLATIAGVAAFGALLVWMTFRQVGTECEVCMTWGDQVRCANVVAPSAEEAMGQARNNACGVLTQGMAAELQCQRTAPRSASCTGD